MNLQKMTERQVTGVAENISINKKREGMEWNSSKC
jgi:hypothetical protein